MTVTPPPIPRLSEWEANYDKFVALLTPQITGDNVYNSIYYDGMYNALMMNERMGTTEYNAFETEAERLYLYYCTSCIPYTDANASRSGTACNYGIAGYWHFSEGLLKKWQVLGDTFARNWMINLSNLAAFASDAIPVSSMQHVDYSREPAYLILSYINCEAAGVAERARTASLVELVFGHFQQWFTLQNAPYVRPFMVAISCRALIKWYGKSADARVLPALKVACDWLWDHCWLPVQKTFMYTDRNVPSGGMEPAWDLNLILCPPFAWVYHMTGESLYQDRADQIFSGGITTNNQFGNWVSGADLGNSLRGPINGKHFCQQYWWSFDYVKWRSMTPLADPSNPGGGTGGGGDFHPFSGEPQHNPTGSVASIWLPTKRETWEEHFVSNGFSSIQDQVDEGFQFYLQPAPLSAEIFGTVDLEAVIDEAAVIVMTYNPEVFDGSINYKPTLSVSLDNVTYTDYLGQGSIFASNFRYVRVRLEATGANRKSFSRVNEIRFRVFLKEKRDGGMAIAEVADVGGTQVHFNKSFNDIDSIVATAQFDSAFPSDEQPQAIYDFEDIPDPTFFTVYLFNRKTGARVGHNSPLGAHGKFSWQVKGH